MPLKSRFFKGDPAFEACLADHAAHITPGARGDHVQKIQVTLAILDGANIAQAELDAKHYGPSTAAAVLAYKKKRKVINPSYQTQADNVVGKMTIAALDDELEARQEDTSPAPPGPCNRPDSFKRSFGERRIASLRSQARAPGLASKNIAFADLTAEGNAGMGAGRATKIADAES